MYLSFERFLGKFLSNFRIYIDISVAIKKDICPTVGSSGDVD
jgi:hypothetical protein